MKTILLSGVFAICFFSSGSLAQDIFNVQELADAVKTGDDVVLMDDLTLTEMHAPIYVYDSQNTNIDGNGYVIDGGDNKTMFLRFYEKNDINEIKNVTFQNIINHVFDEDADDNSGGAISNHGVIGNINANFYNNMAMNGGAIFNSGYIKSISGEFIGNTSGIYGNDKIEVTSSGAAIFNEGWTGGIATIDNITGLFENNTSYSHGAIWNDGGIINNITATFNNNHRSAIGSNGGITNITNSTFYKNDTTGRINYDVGDNYGQSGAAIIYYGEAKINVKDSLFEENHADWKGGAIASTGGSASLIVDGSQFIQNSTSEQGGAIYTESGTVEISNSVFLQNNSRYGAGAIYNKDGMYTITGSTFDANSSGETGGIFNGGNMIISNSVIKNNTSNVLGAGIGNTGTLSLVDTEIFNNKASYWIDRGRGGGIENISGTLNILGGSIHDNIASFAGGAIYVDAGDVTLTNVDIIDNKSGIGGAVHSLVDLKLAADGADMFVSGNNVDTNQTGVFMETAGTTLYLDTQKAGELVFDDVIDGNGYHVNVSGDGSGVVRFNNMVSNLDTLTLDNGGTLYFAKNQNLNVENLVGNNGTMRMDVEADFDNKTLQNGVLNVEKDVSGKTNVFVNLLNDGEFDQLMGVASPFVIAKNDNLETGASFEIARLARSPYLWESKYNIKGDEEGSVWYLAIEKRNDETGVDPAPNPVPDPDSPLDPDPIQTPNLEEVVFAPEISAYVGIQRAVLEQNRSIVDSVARGIAAEKSVNCLSDSCKSEKFLSRKRAWLNTVYENAEINSPSDMDVEIKGVTAGMDFYNDNKYRYGLFAAYRNGKYILSGDGDFYSRLGSKIKTDSYLSGVYYNYKNDSWDTLATLYVGKQDMNIRTEDQFVFASTDVLQYGASIDVSREFALSQYFNLEPNIGLHYTVFDFDDFIDNADKMVSFDTTHYLEAELGMKFEYVFCRKGCTNRIYVKPSVIQTFVSGGKTQITGIDRKVKAYDDELLGRMEVGTEFGISSKLFGFVKSGYTFGEDYKVYDINTGLTYEF